MCRKFRRSTARKFGRVRIALRDLKAQKRRNPPRGEGGIFFVLRMAFPGFRHFPVHRFRPPYRTKPNGQNFRYVRNPVGVVALCWFLRRRGERRFIASSARRRRRHHHTVGKFIVTTPKSTQKPEWRSALFPPAIGVFPEFPIWRTRVLLRRS